jgi:hypothetical protein
MAVCLAKQPLVALFGSLAVAVVLYYLLDFDTEIYASLLRHNPWFLVLADLPYIWLLVTGLFIAMAYYYFHHTKKGYKYGFYTITLATFCLSLVGGTLLYSWSDLPEYVDNLAISRVPFYRQVMMTRDQRWVRPQLGLLGGIIEKLEREIMEVRDWRGTIWQVNIAESNKPSFLQEKISVGIIGDKLDDFRFKARTIRLWNPHRHIREEFRMPIIPKQSNLPLPVSNPEDPESN